MDARRANLLISLFVTPRDPVRNCGVILRVSPGAMPEPIAARGTYPIDEGPDVRLLLERVAAGDREAFRAFYDRYGARVMAVVRKRVAERGLAEELVQDVFVAAWLGAEGYRRDLGDPEGWLLGITRHKVFDHYRRLHRVVAAAVAQPGDGDVADSRIPDPNCRLSVERALVRLTDDQRRLVGLIYGAGLTFAEAARALKVPTGTVKSRVNSALTTLRAFFAGSNAS
jgi:RNA polymerase sigma-70 factor (ECF subfamily)